MERTRTRVRVCAGLAAALALAGCVSRGEVAAPAGPDPAHNSRNAVDWVGSYEGVTPCADCPGIRMRLTLQRDDRFELTVQYLDRQAEPRTVRGTLDWNAAGDTITLQSTGYRFRVGEGRLLLLDHDGGVPSWSAPYRVLTRQPG